MLFFVFCILTAAAFYLFWCQKVVFAKRVVVALGLIFLLVGQGWLPFFLLRSLQTESRIKTPEWKKRNIIVVLGAGVTQWSPEPLWTPPSQAVSRVFEVARLYRLCAETKNECIILASGGDPGQKGRTEAEVLKQELVAVGVSGRSIITESQSNNTFENAQLSSAILRHQNFEQTVLVTSGFHLQRARLYFSHFGVEVVAAPSDRWTTSISWLPKAQNFVFSDLAFNEYVGILRYGLYQLLSLNPPVET